MSSKTPLFLGVRSKAFFVVTLMLFVSASLLLVSASDETGTVASPLSWAIEDEASGHMNDVVSLSYSPDGKWLASGSEDERLLVWDRETEEVVLVFDCGVCWNIWDVEFSPDSTMLAATSDKGNLWVWDTTNWQREDRSGGLDGRSVVFTPDSNSLIMTTRGSQGTPSIMMFDSTTWQVSNEVAMNGGSPYSLSLSPNGDELLVGHANGSIGVWRIADWNQTHLLEQHSSQVTALDFSPNGAYAASGDFSSDLRIWNTADWSLEASDDVRYSSIHDLTFADDSSLLLAYGYDLGLWTSESWTETTRIIDGSEHNILSLHLSPDGAEVLVGGEYGGDLLRRISTSSTEVLGVLQPHASIVRSIATSFDGELVATADESGLIVLSNAASLEVVRTLQADGEIGSVDFSPNGQYLYVLDEFGSVDVFETSSGGLVTTLDTGATDLAPDLLDVSSDGQYLAAANLRSTEVKVWRTSDWVNVATLEGVDWPQSLQFSPDNGLLAIGEGSTSVQGGSGQVHVWSTATWTKETTLTDYDAESYVSFSPSGSDLWVSSSQGEWWDPTYVTDRISVEDWTISATFTGVHRVLDVSPDGTQLLHADCGGSLVNSTDGRTIERCVGGSSYSTSVFDYTGAQIFATAFPGVLHRIGADSDVDGVANVNDACLGTSSNVAVDENGCILSDADSDKDGVLDGDDLCPLTRSNEAVDASGCAARQRDGDDDGVSDLEDDCPTSLETATVDRHGCEIESEQNENQSDTNNSSTTSNNSTSGGNTSNATNSTTDTGDSVSNETSAGSNGSLEELPCTEDCPATSSLPEEEKGLLPWPSSVLSLSVLVLAVVALNRKNQ
ncbi:MAG: hypothetical protein L7U62_01125, partial [Candidatus Poseidoniaceae archaeon]|nr:hypothetical protein [Candidatus Poseidoniaceae archaeon]